MSRVKVEFLVCDRCGKRSDDTTQYTSMKIVGSPFKGDYDLCTECISFFSQAIGMGGEIPRPKTRRASAKTNTGRVRGDTVPATNARQGWSEAEDKFVKENLEMSPEEIAQHVGRSPKAVSLRKRRIQLEQKV